MNIILGYFWSSVSNLSENFEKQLFGVFQIFEKFQNSFTSENLKIYGQTLFWKKWNFYYVQTDS